MNIRNKKIYLVKFFNQKLHARKFELEFIIKIVFVITTTRNNKYIIRFKSI